MKFARLGVLLFSVMFIFASCEKDEQGESMSKDAYAILKDGPGPFTLLAGQDLDVGEVIVTDASGVITIEYSLYADGWRLAETHLHAGYTWEEIPQNKKGNPKIGHFQYKTTHDPYVQSFPVILDEYYDDCFYVAAHADVVYDPVLAFEDVMPDQATLQVVYPVAGGPAYFPTMTITGGTNLDGTYQGWCVDLGNVIHLIQYTVNVYSSTEILPVGVVDNPENFTYVNWILSQRYVGTTNPDGLGDYTYGDVQRAIWHFIDASQSTNSLGAWSPARVQVIIDAAEADGADFIPACGDMIAIVLVPASGAQVTILEVLFADWVDECEASEETAWADGTSFPGDSWAMYFMYGYCTP